MGSPTLYIHKLRVPLHSARLPLCRLAALSDGPHLELRGTLPRLPQQQLKGKQECKGEDGREPRVRYQLWEALSPDKRRQGEYYSGLYV